MKDVNDISRIGKNANVTACYHTRRLVVHAVWTDIEMGWRIVVEVTRECWVGGNVVELLALVICGASHAAADHARCKLHL